MDASTLYARSTVSTSNPVQLVVLLLDRVITAIDRSERALLAGDAPEEAHHELVRAQEILTELQVTLDHEEGGDIARNLSQLYDFCLDRLLGANLAKDARDLPDVRSIVSQLRETWAELAILAPAV